MDRTQAMALLKELIACNLVDASYIAVLQVKPNHYQLEIKCDFETSRLEEFAKSNSLAIKEDRERKYFVIYKP
ncbi:MAG: hypothetical protein ABSF44_10775 [Candidatus Bathyarchaeia archaeon]